MLESRYLKPKRVGSRSTLTIPERFLRVGHERITRLDQVKPKRVGSRSILTIPERFLREGQEKCSSLDTLNQNEWGTGPLVLV